MADPVAMTKWGYRNKNITGGSHEGIAATNRKQLQQQMTAIANDLLQITCAFLWNGTGSA